MQIRTARKEELKLINNLFIERKCILTVDHLESLFVVVNDNNEIIGVGSLVTILEGSFVTNPKASRKQRIRALSMITNKANAETKRLGYKLYYSFSDTELGTKTLKKHYDFRDCAGKTLIKWVD